MALTSSSSSSSSSGSSIIPNKMKWEKAEIDYQQTKRRQA